MWKRVHLVYNVSYVHLHSWDRTV